MSFKYLDKINDPIDLRKISKEELEIVCSEIRTYIIDTLASVGGHFASNLGVVELTVALHYVFDTPIDRLIWDVGHQTYPHKILTGRRESLKTVRKYGGISGFPKREESNKQITKEEAERILESAKQNKINRKKMSQRLPERNEVFW